MLVQSMNPKEILIHLLKDYLKLRQTTVKRLADEYCRERKKFKIDKAKPYLKEYQVKTATKNNWLIYLQKAPSKEKYVNVDSISAVLVTYYFDEKGLKVFNCAVDGMVEMYNGHFFQRYNERLNLKLSTPLEIVNTYFRNNGFASYTSFGDNEKERTIGVCNDGLLLGEIEKATPWLITNKTFISREMYDLRQNKLEIKMIKELKADTECKTINELFEMKISDYNAKKDAFYKRKKRA